MMEKLGKTTRISFNMVQLVWLCLWMVSLHLSHQKQAFGSVMGLFSTCLCQRGLFLRLKSLFLIADYHRLSFFRLINVKKKTLTVSLSGQIPEGKHPPAGNGWPWTQGLQHIFSTTCRWAQGAWTERAVHGSRRRKSQGQSQTQVCHLWSPCKEEGRKKLISFNNVLHIFNRKTIRINDYW